MPLIARVTTYQEMVSGKIFFKVREFYFESEKIDSLKKSQRKLKSFNTADLKVKCNEIWTIFLFSKNLREKVSCINRKQNQLLKISFVRIVAPKTRKSDDFRELHENEPEMAALGVETKL